MSCDAVSAEPFRYSWYGALRDELGKAMLAEPRFEERGRALVKFAMQSDDALMAAYALMKTKPLGQGVMSVAWTFRLDERLAGALMSRAWGQTSNDQWRAMC